MWPLVHSDIKRFYCGLCNRSFKQPGTVVKHFQRCADKVGFYSVVWQFIALCPYCPVLPTNVSCVFVLYRQRSAW